MNDIRGSVGFVFDELKNALFGSFALDDETTTTNSLVPAFFPAPPPCLGLFVPTLTTSALRILNLTITV